jgi:broad specificity phosphatase PhoE
VPVEFEMFGDDAQRLQRAPGDRLVIMHGISSRVLRGVMTGAAAHPEWGAPIAAGLPQGSLVCIEGARESIAHLGSGLAPA